MCKIWVIAAPKKHFLGVWDRKWMRNKLLLLHFFSTFLSPQRATLTYSAVGRHGQAMTGYDQTLVQMNQFSYIY